jgi:hypothetical protein
MHYFSVHNIAWRAGHPIALDLTGGVKGDAPHFPILPALGPDVDPRAAVGDTGYASKANEKDKPAFFAKAIYKGHARIEQAVGKLKRFKRVALHCEKTKAELRIHRRARSGFHLAQIRLHRLATHSSNDIHGHSGRQPMQPQ